MHMADALISPAVGGTMLAVSIGALAYSVKQVKKDFQNDRVPLMGVMGAFVFAAQMINFTIPGTGSSGHIGGAVLLAALLGPYAAFLVTACVLFIQALFFADGGLLALGCNIFNMGFFACFVTYPLIYRPIVSKGYTKSRLISAALLSCVVSLQMGAFSVVLETLVSGLTALPLSTFTLLMQPIHLAIGGIEGILTGLLLIFLLDARPSLFTENADKQKMSFQAVVGSLAVGTLLIGGGLSLLASEHPDGLEWSMEKTAGTTELTYHSPLHQKASVLQEKSAVLPDYSFPESESPLGTSFSGIAGAAATLLMIGGLSLMLKMKPSKS